MNERTMPPFEAGHAWQSYFSLTSQHHAPKPPSSLQGPFPLEDFIKAAKRVAAANKKLRSFEAGFISEEGIKHREWYKHLGVAPGKWLGKSL